MTTDRRRFLLVVAGASAYLLGGFGLLGLGLWSSVGPAEREVFTEMLRAQAAFLAVGAGALVGGLALLISAAWTRTVRPARRLAAEARLVNADPGTARANLTGPAELRDIASGINTLADRVVAGEREVSNQVAAAAADLAQERNRLAALMTQLRVGVLMCTGDGRILLYNAAAQQVLGGGTLVGLGRSVFGVLDRSLIVHAQHRMRASPAGFHEATTAQGGKLLRVQASLVAGEADVPAGFLLVVDDLTRQHEADERRGDLLRSLTEGNRASVANLRAAVENLRDFPEMSAAQRDRFIDIVAMETLNLSARLDEAVRKYSESRDSWFLADMLGADLVGSLQWSFEQELDVQVAVNDPGGAEVWVNVDSHALVQALTAFAHRLATERGIRQLALSLEASARWAQLDVRWPGAALDGVSFRSWTGAPAAGAVDSTADGRSLSAVVDRHGGELWPSTEADDDAYLRLLLPLAEAVDAPVTPSQPRPAEPALPAYDFELLTITAPSRVLDDRRLDELAYTVFDTETTGLAPHEGDEIISIGAVRIVNGRLLRHETFERLIDPGRAVPPAAAAIHGITRSMLEGQPSIDRVLPEFARFADDTVLVGHNVGFDLAFLQLKESSSGVIISQPVLDTLLLSAVVNPEHEGHSLEAIAARLGISVIGRHTALGDALLTGELLLRMLRLLVDQGITTLGEAREASRRTHQGRVTETLYSRE